MFLREAMRFSAAHAVRYDRKDPSKCRPCREGWRGTQNGGILEMILSAVSCEKGSQVSHLGKKGCPMRCLHHFHYGPRPCLAALALVNLFCWAVVSRADRFPPDPVDELRRELRATLQDLKE